MAHQDRDTPARRPPPAPGERLAVDLAGRTWLLDREGNLDALWDKLGQSDFGEDERIPYWTEVWPSSLGLGQWLVEQREAITGRHCLDVGCGLGLTAMLGATLGGRVTGLDYAFDALRYASINAGLNKVEGVNWVQSDWRHPGLAPGGFQVVWGSDVMYEKRFVEPVAGFLESSLARDGVAWLAEPGRGFYDDFVVRVRQAGWLCERAATFQVHPLYSDRVWVDVAIWELRRPDADR